jgi:hypothetical protein
MRNGITITEVRIRKRPSGTVVSFRASTPYGTMRETVASVDFHTDATKAINAIEARVAELDKKEEQAR